MEANKEKTAYYKDITIEDFFDLNFYHPLGYRFALFFSRLNFLPSTVSLISMIIGVFGAILIYYDLHILGSMMVVFSSVLDSSDGQLARMKSLASSYGRIVDGFCGYIVFISIYIAIFLRYKSFYGGLPYCILMFIAGFSNIIQNSVYDFYRTSFVSVKKRDFSFLEVSSGNIFFNGVYRIYLKIQNLFVGRHIFILNLIKESKSYDFLKKIYESIFLRSIQFVNILGDNWKINGLVFLSILERLDLFFFYVIIFLNAVMIFVLIIQRKAEKRFLETIREGIV